MKINLKKDWMILVAIVGVAVVAFYLLHKKRRDRDDDDDDSGRQFAQKGPKVYPFSYTSHPYEDLDDIIEDICDREFKGKCKQECAGGETPQCIDCLMVCEKTSYRLRY